ncbi:MAG: PAS domain S-box protein [Geovibrio sp.]|nr:PAS domain S-box protein [Geovibrio sp.]
MACEISGFSHRELESVSLWELVSPEQQNIVKNSCFSVTGSKGFTKKLQDIRLSRRDGVHKNIFMTISGINYEGKQAALATFTDISEIKEVQHQLERKIAAEVEKTPPAGDGVHVSVTPCRNGGNARLHCSPVAAAAQHHRPLCAGYGRCI